MLYIYFYVQADIVSIFIRVILHLKYLHSPSDRCLPVLG